MPFGSFSGFKSAGHRIIAPSRKSYNQAVRNKQVRRQVNKVLDRRVETKFYNYNVYNQAGVDYNGTMSSALCTPAQGDAYNERVGDRIDPFLLRLRLGFISAGTTNMMRLIVFRWKVDNNVDAPQASDLLVAGYIGTAMAPIAPILQNQSAKDNFTILLDKTVFLSETTRETFYLDKTIKLRGKIGFNAGAISGNGHIYCLAITDDGAVTYPTVNLTTEVHYKDA